MKAAAKHQECCDHSLAIEEPLSPGKRKIREQLEHQSLLHTFLAIGLPTPSNSETWVDFTTLTKEISKFKTIGVTSRVLRWAFKYKERESTRKARIFLAAYIIYTCTKDILSNMKDEQEQRLYESAKNLLLQFEHCVNVHMEDMDEEADKERIKLQDVWADYTREFESWKTKDQVDLLKDMTAYYIEMARLKHHLAEKDADNGSFNDEMETVRKRINQLGGADAVQCLDEAEKPYKVDPTCKRTEDKQTSQVDEEQMLLSKAHIEELFDKEGVVQYNISCLKLVHELVLDPEFKLQKHASESDLEQRVKEMATKAFFDKLDEEYNTKDCKFSLMYLLDEVRRQLVVLANNRSDISEEIAAKINLEAIDHQYDIGTFNLDQLLDLVLGILSKICAPVRDEAIKAAYEKDRPIDKVSAIFDILEDTSLDLINYRLAEVRPLIVPSSAEYERYKFNELLEQDIISLDRTKKWILNTTEQMESVTRKRGGPQPASGGTQGLTAENVFFHALLDYLLSPKLITEATVPETLTMDLERLAVHQNEIQAMTMVTSLVTLARNFGATDADALQNLSDRLFLMLEDHSTTIDNISSEIGRVANATNKQIDSIRSMVDRTLSHTDTVFSLFTRRIQTMLLTHLQTGKPVTESFLTRSGLGQISKQLQSLSDKLYVMAIHHFRVFSPWYNDILATRESAQQTKVDHEQ